MILLFVFDIKRNNTRLFLKHIAPERQQNEVLVMPSTHQFMCGFGNAYEI